MRSLASSLATLGLLLGIAPTATLAQPSGTPLLAPLDVSAPKNTKLTSHLVRVAAAEKLSRASGRAVTSADLSALPEDLRAMVTARLMRIDGRGRVQVYISPSATINDAEAATRLAGGEVELSDARASLVQAWLPTGRLEGLAADPAVKYVRLPDYGFAQTGSVETEGDAILRANLVRSTYGVDGTGVRVGVISNGVAGMASSQATGDLPPSVNTTTCNVAGGDPGPPGAAEGTAMMEIVHDLAPGAQLWFGHQVTSIDFDAAVTCLTQNTDVVVDDISFLNVGPYDGTSSVSANTSGQLANLSHPVRGYVTSVGNFAIEHYEEVFADSGFTLTSGPTVWKVHQFASTANTSDGGVGAHCSGSTGPYCYNAVPIAAGQTITVRLEWDDPFGGSTNDYDLFLFDRTSGTLVAHSTNPQTGTQDPTEILAWTNPHATGLFDIVIGLRSGTAKRLHLFVPECTHGACGNALPNGAFINFNTVSHSVPNEADAGGGVISVGAISASDPGNTHIETYSSQGPTADGRTKPDITGIDCVSVTGAGGFHVPFCGTSAAAPHIAGIMALLLQLKPELKAGGSIDPATARNSLRQAIFGTAVALGGPAPNNTFGAGRADALAAAQSLERGSGAPCVSSPTTLCIDQNPGDGRFMIQVSFHTSQGGGSSGSGNGITLSSLGVTEGGLFWFFGATNPEMLIKIIDGCSLGGHFWVFYAATTNVGFTVTVTDTSTGHQAVYHNMDLTAALPVQDTGALTCP